MSVRTRFAPSPTGYLHVGGARTALFNYLFAKKHGGQFILRVEDTDEERNTDEARDAIFSGLRWLGIEWDEGPEVGGDHGPYNQSERQEIYDQWFQKLIDADRVYEDDGAWRFRFERKLMIMNDLICGEVSIDYTNVDNTPDMVVKRSNGTYTFHFVNVVDDIEMGMTHVIRGEDHLMNTPKHIQLFHAFGVTPPKFAHMPLILDSSGAKMSKRHAAAAVDSYAPKGYTSPSLVNFLASLGWTPDEEKEIFTIEELTEAIDLTQISRAPAKFDEEKCAWMNQQHLMQLSHSEYAEAVKPFAEEAGIVIDDRFETIAASVQEKVRLLPEIAEWISFFYNADYPFDSEALAKVQKNEAAPALLSELAAAFSTLADWSEAKATIGATAKANGAKPGHLMFPTRVALSGLSGGPDLGAILEILGQAESVRRIHRAVSELS